jgi:hypothetical protein
VWWAFACAAHVEYLTAARALLDRDRAELARRRRPREDRDGATVGPVATGRQARELIARARRWAERHREHLYPAAPPDRVPSRQ